MIGLIIYLYIGIAWTAYSFVEQRSKHPNIRIIDNIIALCFNFLLWPLGMIFFFYEKITHK